MRPSSGSCVRDGDRHHLASSRPSPRRQAAVPEASECHSDASPSGLEADGRADRGDGACSSGTNAIRFPGLPGPVGNRQACRYGGSPRVVDMHVSDGPLHVVADPRRKSRSSGRWCGTAAFMKQATKRSSSSPRRFNSGTEGQHAGLSIRRRAVERGSAEIPPSSGRSRSTCWGRPG